MQWVWLLERRLPQQQWPIFWTKRLWRLSLNGQWKILDCQDSCLSKDQFIFIQESLVKFFNVKAHRTLVFQPKTEKQSLKIWVLQKVPTPHDGVGLLGELYRVETDLEVYDPESYIFFVDHARTILSFIMQGWGPQSNKKATW